ncbi:cysteine-rich receptor-like protein kinase 15 [Primulina tabacum]|uniref:cysteine-rich receptor-like protein kinase 15 n=1 Tax=Primulina tabacum TaxID=48773 RepID=UPI003F5A85AF
MDSQRSSLDFIFIVFMITNILGFVTSQVGPAHCYFDDRNNYTSNSVYESNLNALLSSLSSNVDSFGFYNASIGKNPDQVNAIVLCRADAQVDACRSCVTNGTSELVRLCPNQKKAALWNDLCMVRYSNNPTYGILDTYPPVIVRSTSTFSDNGDLRQLLDELRRSAVSGGPLLKVGGDSKTAPDYQVIYGLMQCTPDLPAQVCDDCLVEAGKIINGSERWRMMKIFLPSCNIWYGLSRFYDVTTLQERISAAAATTPPPSPAATTPPPSPAPTGKSTARTVIFIVVPIVASLILVAGICVFLRRRIKHKRRVKLESKCDYSASVDDMSIAESIQFDFNEIRAATDDFSDANKLGQGGFGSVYKGSTSKLPEIAVKRLSRDFGQGDNEFKNEVVLVARLQHRNLVRLLGFSIKGTERLLIYEFVQNASLDHFLFNSDRRSHLDWERRYKIITGIARGLLYLHEDSRLRIIHRDLKASNILLDGEMIAKIADFGMARLFEKDETQGNTSRIVGTYGYMAPEYAMHGQFSIKSDVFSFGVLVLEILTGQRNNSFRNGENTGDLLSSAWSHWREGTAINMIDPMLKDGSNSMREILRCFHISLLCVQENAVDRPTMANVALMLSSFSLTLPLPSEPAFFVPVSFGTNVSPLNSVEFSESSAKLSRYNSTSKSVSSTSGVYPR